MDGLFSVIQIDNDVEWSTLPVGQVDSAKFQKWIYNRDNRDEISENFSLRRLYREINIPFWVQST